MMTKTMDQDGIAEDMTEDMTEGSYLDDLSHDTIRSKDGRVLPTHQRSEHALNIPLDQFLSPFFDSGETVHIRVFDDKKNARAPYGSAFKGQKLQCAFGKITSLADTLHKHNAQGRGIFFVVNYGGYKDEDISRVNALFVENDSLSVEEQIAQLESFPLPPSLMVRTAKSVHAYWLVKDVQVNEFRSMQKKLIAQFDGDPSCVNESRVLRLPGFFHCKGTPVMVECIKFAPDLRYTKAQLDEALPQIAGMQDIEADGSGNAHTHTNANTNAKTNANAASTSKGSRKGLTLVSNRCAFIRYCKEHATTLPENLWYGMISNLAVFEGGGRVIHALSKAYPTYSHNETEDKIRHFLCSGTKPMTCAKLTELGFSCPMMADTVQPSSGGSSTGGSSAYSSTTYGSSICGCKSPAALCYKPMTAEELLIVLNSYEIPDSAIDKIKTIKEFIQEYLYNVEPVIAETLINHEVKERFRLTTSDLRPLLSLHREAWKRYSDGKDTRREAAMETLGEGAELPEWYEVTDKGGLRFLPGALADHMARNMHVFFGAASYFFYEGGVYVPKDDMAAFAATRSFMMTRSAKSTEIADAERQWRSIICKPVREINANPFIINVRNGLYNVLDDTFREHNPEYMSTVQINANYDPAAKCPLFLTFLSDVLPDTEHDLLQEILGYLLIPVNKAQKAFVMVGAANAGKSSLLSIAQELLLGSKNVSNIPWQGLSDRFNKAELFGKLANIFADLPSKAIDDDGLFKSLTGEDYISGERKGKDPFHFKPYARLLFSCNEMPKNYADRSEGFYRRLIIIRFAQSVDAGKRDPNLRERISCERDGILTWSLDGLRRLITNNYQFSETERTRTELQRYKVESNSALLFLDECCEVGVGYECVRETMFEKYKDYCAKNGLKAMSQTNFNKDVEASDVRICRARDKVGSRHIWRGVRICV